MNYEFEINPLTRIQGGSFLELEFENGETSRGINVKSVKKYLSTIIAESLLRGNNLVRAYRSSTNEIVYESGKFYL